MLSPEPQFSQKPHPRRRIVHRRFILEVGETKVELFHVLYPTGEHELRTIPYDGEGVTSGRRKFHEMAHISGPFAGFSYTDRFVANTCHLQLPEVFRMAEIEQT